MHSELEIMANAPDEKGPTSRIKEAMAALIREINLMERLEKIAADTNRLDEFRENAEKARKIAERLEKKLQRAYAAANSAYQMEVKEKE
jgi:ABC-type uncharacterized transport system fused permease/ATPase subunit